MTLTRARRLSLIAALLLPLLAPAASETDWIADALAARHAQALAAYEIGHWVEAYQGFAALADEGHRPAARVALLMASRGPVLYGKTFAAPLAQRQRWAALQTPPMAVDFFDADPRLARR